MSSCASAPATPMWMQPEGPAAVTASAVLPKRYFTPKPPAPPQPAQQRMYAEEARRRQPAIQPRADYSRPHRPRVWWRDGLSWPEHPRQRSHHLHHAQPGVSKPRARCDGQRCRMGVLSLGSGGGGCTRRTGPPRARSVSGPRSRVGRRSPGRPPSPPPPHSRPRRCRASWSPDMVRLDARPCAPSPARSWAPIDAPTGGA